MLLPNTHRIVIPLCDQSPSFYLSLALVQIHTQQKTENERPLAYTLHEQSQWKRALRRFVCVKNDQAKLPKIVFPPLNSLSFILHINIMDIFQWHIPFTLMVTTIHSIWIFLLKNAKLLKRIHKCRQWCDYSTNNSKFYSFNEAKSTSEWSSSPCLALPWWISNTTDREPWILQEGLRLMNLIKWHFPLRMICHLSSWLWLLFHLSRFLSI